MQLTLQIKLLVDTTQKDSLLRTMVAFNAAANLAAKAGFDGKVFSQPSIHGLTYYDIRTEYKLTAQLAVRAIGKAVDCFKRDKTVCPVFKPRSAVVYDERIMRFKGLTAVSLASLDGRLTIPIVIAGYQQRQLERALRTGQADLVYRTGKFYLLLTVELPDGPAREAVGVLGVDLGVEQIAVDSEGNFYTGEDVEKYRQKMQRLRNDLQSCGTRSAKRHLKRMAQREANYRRTKNHQISRRIVDLAKARNCAIALENLTGIRQRTRFRSKQRARMSGWAFHQLRSFIAYKCVLAGVTMILVDPRNTSRTCNVCGHCEKGNRKSQAEFLCLSCGHKANADFNAARNIRAEGDVKPPIVTNVDQRALAVAS